MISSIIAIIAVNSVLFSINLDTKINYWWE